MAGKVCVSSSDRDSKCQPETDPYKRPCNMGIIQAGPELHLFFVTEGLLAIAGLISAYYESYRNIYFKL